MHPRADVVKCQKWYRLRCSSRSDMRATSVSSAEINVQLHNHATQAMMMPSSVAENTQIKTESHLNDANKAALFSLFTEVCFILREKKTHTTTERGDENNQLKIVSSITLSSTEIRLTTKIQKCTAKELPVASLMLPLT